MKQHTSPVKREREKKTNRKNISATNKTTVLINTN
jgi:hypothetical protein